MSGSAMIQPFGEDWIPQMKKHLKEGGAMYLPVTVAGENPEDCVQLHLELEYSTEQRHKQLLNVYVLKQSGEFGPGEEELRGRFHTALIAALKEEFPDITIPPMCAAGSTENILFPSPFDEIARDEEMLDKLIGAVERTYSAVISEEGRKWQYRVAESSASKQSIG